MTAADVTGTAAGLTGADALYWHCERCGAGPGQRCRTARRTANRVHANRVQAARLWLKYGGLVGR